MKKITLFISIIVAFSSCAENYQPRKTVEISLENFKIDSSSIRAIEIINDSTVIYAGSKGDLGIIRGQENTYNYI